MTPAKHSKVPSTPARDMSARALLLAIVLALAVTGGASFSAAGSGALQEILRFAGWDRGAIAEKHQRQQAAALGELERVVGVVIGEVATLNSQREFAGRDDSTGSDRLARLDAEIAALKNEVAAVRAARNDGAGESWRAPVADLDATLRGAQIDITALRSSLDGHEQKQRKDLAAITQRIDRIENVLAAREVTGSIRKTSLKRRPHRGAHAARTGAAASARAQAPANLWVLQRTD